MNSLCSAPLLVISVFQCWEKELQAHPTHPHLKAKPKRVCVSCSVMFPHSICMVWDNVACPVQICSSRWRRAGAAAQKLSTWACLIITPKDVHSYHYFSLVCALVSYCQQNCSGCRMYKDHKLFVSAAGALRIDPVDTHTHAHTQ